MGFNIKLSEEYKVWFEAQSQLTQAQIKQRLTRVKNDAHFGHIGHIESKLWELKFNNGLRIYFFRSTFNQITLIFGGTKHGQKKDIQKAKKILNI